LDGYHTRQLLFRLLRGHLSRPPPVLSTPTVQPLLSTVPGGCADHQRDLSRCAEAPVFRRAIAARPRILLRCTTQIRQISLQSRRTAGRSRQLNHCAVAGLPRRSQTSASRHRHWTQAPGTRSPPS